tara:strand:- start:126302 stop:126889 length:588 start_codon:yes stop_codon:yes gene_type:complete
MARSKNNDPEKLDMADASDDLNLAKGQGEGSTGKSGGMKKIIIIVGIVVVLLGAAAGAYFMLAGGANDEAAPAADGAEAAAVEEAPAEPETDPIYLALSPAFVVNFQENGRTRYLQIELQAMAYDQEIIDKVQSNMPAVRNNLILLFSEQDYAALNSIAGKEALRKQVLDSINEAVRAKAPKQVSDVFFTGFVMQ